MEILKVNNLTKCYRVGECTVHALNGATFSVEKGEFISILGPSGSGKSTLLHLLGGVDKPTEGEVIIKDTNIYELNDTKLAIFRRQNIGLIYQFYNLIPVLNVEENILLPALLDGKQADQEKLNKLIKVLGLDERTEHFPNQLSGGQQQRVSIGRALYTEPDIILADEPTGNLDKKNTQDIMNLLRELNRTYEQTIIMITHNESLAEQCDRIFYLEDGKLK